MIPMDASDMTRDDWVAVEKRVAAVLSELSPGIDTRAGTALHGLLQVPAAKMLAELDGAVDKFMAQVTLGRAARAGSVDPDVLDILAENYKIPRRLGSKSSGVAKVNTNSDQTFTLLRGFTLSSGGLNYATTEDYHVGSDGGPEFHESDSGYFFLIEVEAESPGPEYNVDQGSAMTVVDDYISSIGSAEAYGPISGGSSDETAAEYLERRDAMLSYVSLESASAIRARLFDSQPYLLDVSVVGMGDREMLRDKHNAFGVSLGSRVDIYVRPSGGFDIDTLIVEAGKVEDGVYEFEIPAGSNPGLLGVRSVTSPSSAIIEGSSDEVLGSYEFSVEWVGAGPGDVYHDFADDNLVVETAWTKWRGAVVRVSGMDPVLSGGAAEYPEKLSLKVQTYSCPGVAEAQALVDSPDVRNREADHVARGSAPCFVSINITIYKRASSTVDIGGMTKFIANSVNGLRFGSELTRSKIISWIHSSYDVERVDSEFALSGMFVGASGANWTITGDLKPDEFDWPSELVTGSTAAFLCDSKDVFVEVRSL